MMLILFKLSFTLQTTSSSSRGHNIHPLPHLLSHATTEDDRYVVSEIGYQKGRKPERP